MNFIQLQLLQLYVFSPKLCTLHYFHYCLSYNSSSYVLELHFPKLVKLQAQWKNKSYYY